MSTNGCSDGFKSAEHEQKLKNLLLEVNGPLYQFYNIMGRKKYSLRTSGSSFDFSFHPDISGYTLAFLQPPHLSGYEELNMISSQDLLNFTKQLVCFLAVDFTPPPIQVTASELPSRSGSLPYAVEVSGTGQLSISYIDDQQEHCFGFHKLWTSYIEDITRGQTIATNQRIRPAKKYYDSSNSAEFFGQIDYMTSAYVIKFKPVSGSLGVLDVIYIGKATGIFPINQPDKEVIGRRDSPDLVTITYNYPCANYRAWSAGTPNSDKDIYIRNEYIDDIYDLYSYK